MRYLLITVGLAPRSAGQTARRLGHGPIIRGSRFRSTVCAGH